MEGSAGAPPQRVCPKCARISWATGPQCPYCRARFARPPGVRPWMLAVTAAVVLLGVLVMFIIAGNRFEDRVAEVNRQVERELNQLREEVRREIDNQSQQPSTPPTPTPFPTPTPTPSPTDTATPTPTPDDGTGTSPEPSPTIGP